MKTPSSDPIRCQPCWLAGRLRRAALHHGQALALQLQSGQPGVLLLQVDEAAGLEWLSWLRELLVQMVELASGLARSAPLLSADPQPALLLDAEARLLESNASLQGLQQLLSRLRVIDGQKSLVIISEGLIIEDPANLDDTIRLAAAAQASVNVLMMDVMRGSDVTRGVMPPTMTEDRELQMDGLREMASASRLKPKVRRMM